MWLPQMFASWSYKHTSIRHYTRPNLTHNSYCLSTVTFSDELLPSGAWFRCTETDLPNCEKISPKVAIPGRKEKIYKLTLNANSSRVTLFNDYVVLDRRNKSYVIGSLVPLFVLETMVAKSTNDWSPTMTWIKKVSHIFSKLTIRSDRMLLRSQQPSC